MIKLQGVCLFGNDLTNSLNKIRPGYESLIIAHNLINIEKKILSYPNNKFLLSVLMKNIVRVGQELVSGRNKIFSRDVFLCYREFVKYYPDKHRAMFLVYSYSVGHNFIMYEDYFLLIKESLFPWIINEFKRVYKDFNYTKSL